MRLGGVGRVGRCRVLRDMYSKPNLIEGRRIAEVVAPAYLMPDRSLSRLQWEPGKRAFRRS
jgi:hypothetical protein